MTISFVIMVRKFATKKNQPNFFFLIILNGLAVKCVIEFGRFVRILEGPTNGYGKKGSQFSIFNRIGLCVGLKILFFKSMGLLKLMI
jgi:hypothetical protein